MVGRGRKSLSSGVTIMLSLLAVHLLSICQLLPPAHLLADEGLSVPWCLAITPSMTLPERLWENHAGQCVGKNKMKAPRTQTCDMHNHVRPRRKVRVTAPNIPLQTASWEKRSPATFGQFNMQGRQKDMSRGPMPFDTRSLPFPMQWGVLLSEGKQWLPADQTGTYLG